MKTIDSTLLKYGDAFPDENFEKIFSPWDFDFTLTTSFPSEGAIGMTYTDTRRVQIYLVGHDTISNLYQTLEHEALHAAIASLNELEEPPIDLEHEHFGIAHTMMADTIFGDSYFSIYNHKIIRPKMRESKYVDFIRRNRRDQAKIRECA